jgi:hypothetical protein
MQYCHVIDDAFGDNEDDVDVVELVKTGDYSGVRIDGNTITQDKCILTYDIQMVSGTLSRIGGNTSDFKAERYTITTNDSI